MKNKIKKLWENRKRLFFYIPCAIVGFLLARFVLTPLIDPLFNKNAELISQIIAFLTVIGFCLFIWYIFNRFIDDWVFDKITAKMQKWVNKKPKK